MQLFFWLVFLTAIGVATLVIQNSTAPMVVINFLFWKFETSLTYTIFGSIGCGMLIILLLWIPRGIKTSFWVRNLKKRIEILEREGSAQESTFK